ncbi:MAG: hypothetical protein NTY09_07810 [bacterium]|nr:hypothetical protein [bacterium]
MKGFWLNASLIISGLFLVTCAGGGVLTPGDFVPPVWDTTVGVTSVVPGENQVTVTWGTATDSMSPPVEYLVYIDTDENPWDTSPVIKPTNDPHVFANLDNTTEYWCGVRCMDSADPPNIDDNVVVMSATPEEGQVNLDTTPPVWDETVGVITVVPGEGSVTVQWGTATDAESPPVEYLLYRDEDDDPWDQEPIVLSTNDPYTFTDLFSNIAYLFGVRCRDSADVPNADSNENFLMSETIPRGWTVDWKDGYFQDENVQVDSLGNIYIMGEKKWGVDYDPSVGTSYGPGNAFEDVFVLKLNPDREFQWAGQMSNGGESSQVSKVGFCIDSNDEIYVCFFAGYNNETHLLKVDNEGNKIWDKVLYTYSQSTAYVHNEAVAIDAYNNIYVIGYFFNTIDFNPGSGEGIYTSNGSSDCFLVKLDSSGTFKWVKTWGGNEFDVPYVLEIDPNGNIYVGGDFENTVDFDPGLNVDTHISNGLSDAFLSSFDLAGNFRWARIWGGSGNDTVYDVVANSSGVVYAGGSFYNQVDFNPGPDEDIQSAIGGWGPYLCRYDSSGDYKFVYLWKPLSMHLCFDEHDNLYMAGFFNEDVDLNPGDGSDFQSIGPSHAKSYLSKYNPSGDYLWSRVWGGLDSAVFTNGIESFSNNVFVVGTFWGDDCDFDPGPGVEIHVPTHPYDLVQILFLSKFPQDGGYW